MTRYLKCKQKIKHVNNSHNKKEDIWVWIKSKCWIRSQSRPTLLANHTIDQTRIIMLLDHNLTIDKIRIEGIDRALPELIENL